MLLQLILVVGCCAGLAAATSGSTRSPVEQVVQLLTDLKSKLELDEKSEQQVYDKFACWCEKTTARKAAAITEAQEELRILGQTMLTLKGKIATIVSEIEQLAQAIKASEEALAEALAVREKQNTEYQAATAEMKLALVALQQAITVLKSATAGSSFLQQGTHAISAVQRVVELLPTSAVLSPKQESFLSEFVSMTGGSTYAPQSITVQGILENMYQNFARDTQDATQEEATRNRDYELFKEEKEALLKTLNEEKTTKEGLKAEAETLLADTTQNYDDTEGQKKADIDFFDQTKAACEAKHEEWVTRSDLRSQEIEGVAKAIEILSSDEARELFNTAIKEGKETHADESYDTGSITSLLQLSGGNTVSIPAYKMLRESARKAHSLRLASLAVRVQATKVGHFDEVVKAIDEMIKTLQAEDAADIAKRDQCKEEYQKINSTIADLSWSIEKNQAAIDKLERLIADLSEERIQTIEDIKAVEQEMKQLTLERKAENEAFLQAKSEDQAVIKLLAEARTVLTEYYTKHSIELGPIQGDVKGLAFNQQGPFFNISADQAPEADFSDKGSRKHETKDIVSIMTMLIEDVADEIKNAMKAEENAQLEYEHMMALASKLKEELEEKVLNLETMIAQREEEKDTETSHMITNQKDLKDEHDYKASIKNDCDWIIGAFTERAKKRVAEMDGLVGAKEYLAGAQASLLATNNAKGLDDSALSNVEFLGIAQ